MISYTSGVLCNLPAAAGRPLKGRLHALLKTELPWPEVIYFIFIFGNNFVR
jgi:hypothetical protein